MCPFCFAHTTTILTGVAGSFSAGSLGALLLRGVRHRQKAESHQTPTSETVEEKDKLPNDSEQLTETRRMQ